MRRLIINADDFGRSASINAAVIRAHTEGILSSASLMVNEPGFEEAVHLARRHPRLGVGLHLTLVCGQSALGPDRLPGLVDSTGRFPETPVRHGWRCYSRSDLREPLRAEIHAQFATFRRTGLTLDHLNGHLHFHLHPVVFDLLVQDAAELGIGPIRLPREPFWLNARMASGHWASRSLHAVIFRWLSARALPAAGRLGWKHADQVFGLLQSGRVDEGYLARLLPRLPAGTTEIYSHPSLDAGQPELDALVSAPVRRQVCDLGLQLTRYQDL